VRTLIVSDLHLGIGRHHCVLELPRPRERLLAALEGVQRLVLLGDVVELLGRPASHSMRAAEPVLRAVGERLDPGAEVVLVPGNHDRALIRRWLRARREPLGLDTKVPPDASSELQRLVSWLGPADVHAFYPGVFLGEGIWATHGHYLDRHLLPDSSYGMARGLLGRLPSDGARPEEYEPGGGPSLRSVGAALPGPVRWSLDGLAEVARAATAPLSPGRLLSPRMAPLTRPVLSFQMRHASLPALARVVHRLGVDAQTVIFGHIHRLGPRAGDEESHWYGPSGRPEMFNCGSWTYEPLLLYRASPPHPYWPGGALVLEDGQRPRPVGLLDDLGAAELRSGRRGRVRARATAPGNSPARR
jgi:UDP-2,3-diacylglucosamine pyrophosphatase LpxH